MSIPSRFMDEIRNRLTLSDIIGRRISVTRAGREFKACCPFHKEKTPSFTINDDKQFYHCFGCGAHGDVIGFVMQHDNLSFMDAVESLAAEAGLDVPKPDPKAIAKAEKTKDLHSLMDEATSWMQAQLVRPENTDVLEYLEGRGISEATRAQFRIGYTPPDAQALRQHLAGKNYTDTQMLDAGILKKSNKGGEPYVFFRDRVMFPVADRRGRVVAYGGRILPEHIRPQTDRNFTPPKYINSSDTPLFDKGRMLYGESIARQAARDGHTILVTEGYMDVIACHKAGFKGAVAPMGTALTEDQIMMLWSMQVDDEKQPLLCFDGDDAGRRAASRACERILPLLQPGKTARFAFLPEGEDPDSLIRGGGAKGFRNILSASLSLFDFIWAGHTAGRSFDTPEARAGLTKTLHKEVLNIADNDIQKHYRELIRTRISEQFFQPYNKRGSLSRQQNKNNPAHSLRLRSPAIRKNNVSAKIVLASILNNPSLYKHLEEEFGRLTLADQKHDKLRQAILMTLEKEPELESDALRSILESEGFGKEIDDILNESVYVHAAFSRKGAFQPEKEAEILKQWRTIYQALEAQGSKNEVRQGWKQAFENSSEEEENILKEMINIKRSDTV